jgi:hypothetical protein
MEEPATTQTKEETSSSLRPRDVKRRQFSECLPHQPEKDDDGRSGRILSGNSSGRAALRREQLEQFESNHREK